MTVIAVCQLGLAVGELEANRAAAAAAVTKAAARGARLVVLPELSDSGYAFHDEAEARRLAAPAAQSPTLHRWQELAASHEVVIVGGFCELGEDGNLYNSAAVVDGSGTLAVYRKAHLWDREKLIFVPGNDEPPVVDLPFGRVATMVCYDLEFPEWVRVPALRGADLIAAPVNWPVMPEIPGMPVPPEERRADIVRVQGAAAANGLFIAVADRCRSERGVSWVGGAVIIRPDGYPAAKPDPGDHELLLTADCDLAKARDKRISDHNDVLADRRPELYQRVSRPSALVDP